MLTNCSGVASLKVQRLQNAPLPLFFKKTEIIIFYFLTFLAVSTKAQVHLKYGLYNGLLKITKRRREYINRAEHILRTMSLYIGFVKRHCS